MGNAHISETDLISNLPDDLLLHTMRLPSMKARTAMQTCILSNRWSHLWEFLPDLNFDLREFNGGDSEQDKQRFSSFVTTMLKRRKATILDKFRLSCMNLCGDQYYSSTNNWIEYAIGHKIQVLELAVCICSVEKVLINVFTCDSIEKLHLHVGECDNFTNDFLEHLKMDCKNFFGSTAINLPKLRKLQLYGDCLSGDGFITKLISGCPLKNFG